MTIPLDCATHPRAMRLMSGVGTGVPRALPVTLARAATVAASLQATVEPTFGPMGGDRLMVNDANQIILTNSGQLILEVRRPTYPRPPPDVAAPVTATTAVKPPLPITRYTHKTRQLGTLTRRSLPSPATSRLQMVSVSHPVGAFLIHAVQAHTSKTGDGTVAMLAMITGGLQKVRPPPPLKSILP